MEKDFSKRNLVCPNCGSPDRFMEQLGQELKDRKLFKEEMRAYYEVKQGTLLDQSRVAFIPLGSMLPGFHIATDICMKCGTIYAVELVRTEGKFMGIQPEKPKYTPRFSAN